MNIRAITLLSAAAISFGIVTGPAAQADSGQATSLSSVEKSILFLDISAQGEIQYMDSSNHLITTPPITAKSSCTAEWVSTKADALTAGHCTDQNENRKGIIDQFLQSGLDGNKPNVTKDQIINVMGPDGPGSQLDITVTATQTLGVPGAVLNDDGAPATIVPGAWSPSQGDLALVHVDVPLPPTPALAIAPSSPLVGDWVTAAGYPGVVGEALQSKWTKASMFKGQISAHQPTNPKGNWPSLETDAKFLPGMSGGPILNDKFQMVGDVSNHVEDAGNSVSYATDTPQLRQFLQQHGIALQQTAPAPVKPAPPSQASRPASTQHATRFSDVVTAFSWLISVLGPIVH